MHSSLRSLRSEAVARRDGGLHGVGLFTNRPVSKGEILAYKRGQLVTEDVVKKYASVIAGSHQQLAPGVFLAGLTDQQVDATLIGYNHSCDPNAYVDDIALRAMKEIPEGVEVTADYAMCFNTDTQSFTCSCGSKLCRHEVSPQFDCDDAELMSRYNGYRAYFLHNPDCYKKVTLVPVDSHRSASSWVSSKITRVDSSIHGSGSIANTYIAQGECIAIRGGSLLTQEDVVALRDVLCGSEMQIDDHLFLGATSAQDRLSTLIGINHSCDPNLQVGTISQLFALRDVARGEELTIDYATAYISESQHFSCACGSQMCREFVDTTQDWMIPELQERYQGAFAPFIQRKIDGHRFDFIPE